MELLSKQALVGRRDFVTGWSGLLSSTTSLCSAAKGPGLAVGLRSNVVRCLKLLPRITLLSRNLGCGRGPQRHSFCKCGSVLDNFPMFYSIQWMGLISYRSFSEAEHRGNLPFSHNASGRDKFPCSHNATGGEVEDFSERRARRGGRFKMKGKWRGLPAATPSLKNDISEGRSVNLELEIFCFMRQSSKPDAFPSKQELVSAGRTDLVQAICAEGGWLTAGWEEGEIADLSSGNSAMIENSYARGERIDSLQRPRRKSKVRSPKFSSNATKSSRTTKMSGEMIYDITERLNGNDVVWEVVDCHDGRGMSGNEMMKLNIDDDCLDLFPILEQAQQSLKQGSADQGWRFSSRPTDDDLQSTEETVSFFSLTEEPELKRPQRRLKRGNLSQTSTRSNFVKHYGVKDAKVIPKRKKKRLKEGENVEVNCIDGEVNGSLDWIGQMVDDRTKWMLEARSKSSKNSSRVSLVADQKSLEDRIHTLEVKLVDTCAALQSRREELWRTGNDEVHQQALSEILDAEDALEFHESAILHAHHELSTTRAQVAAVEGTLKLDLMEAQKTLQEKNQKLEKAATVLMSLRTARIVWPNPAQEVFLTGSFDGWKSQVKMEKSSAGVFVVAVPLYPGRYEIKFVVDGSWRIDINRPIAYVGGFENNVMWVS